MLHNAAIFSQPKSLLMWFMFRLDPSLLCNPEFTGLVFTKTYETSIQKVVKLYHKTSLYICKRTLETDEKADGLLSPRTPSQTHNMGIDNQIT